MSKYVRKTRDEWVVQTDWGDGWCDDCPEDTYKEAKERAKEYIDNSSGRYKTRIVHRRVRIVQKEA